MAPVPPLSLRLILRSWRETRAKVGAMPVAEIYQVAVPAPLRRSFDYLATDNALTPMPGVRVRVPFGRRQVIGVLLAVTDHSEIPRSRLKPVLEVLDKEPVIEPGVFKLLQWAATYYHYPIGEVFQAALPVALRQGQLAEMAAKTIWKSTVAGAAANPSTLKRAPLQHRLLSALSSTPSGLDAKELAKVAPGWRNAVVQLEAKGWAEKGAQETMGDINASPAVGPALNQAQQVAVAAVIAGLGKFQRYLLYGVTGSGKTEVYIHAIKAAIDSSSQVLVLVPEISLTPQLVDRFQSRLPVPLAVLHSGLSAKERLQAWLAAKSGQASVVLGTRSAVMTPMPKLGLIIVDEEHDSSYKQQEGFRYHARDLAIIRARNQDVPVILGSATPSLESLYNAEQKHYQLLSLPERTGSAQLPKIQCLDMRRLAVTDGLSPSLIAAIKNRLERGEQSILFLNRRGFSPVYMCHECGWVVPCKRCDANLTFHQASKRLRCHHCGTDTSLLTECEVCRSRELKPLGQGTERIEINLKKYFPDARIARVDRDTTQRKGSLENILAKVHQGKVDIIVGTQMLSKGHDFPNVTLVGILNVDQGLYSLDFRAPEYTFQQAMQVSGRAGRANKPGEVLVQTYHPDHQLFNALVHHDYLSFARGVLDERRATDFPPYTYLALLRVETPQKTQAMDFAGQAVSLARTCSQSNELQITDPMSAPMERRAGRYRVQVLVQSAERKMMHHFLTQWLPMLEESKEGKRVRWSLDRDPIDLY